MHRIDESINTVEFIHYFVDTNVSHDFPAQASVPKPVDAVGLSFVYDNNPPVTLSMRYRQSIIIPINPNIHAIELTKTFIGTTGPQRSHKQTTILVPDGATGLTFKFDSSSRLVPRSPFKPRIAKMMKASSKCTFHFATTRSLYQADTFAVRNCRKELTRAQLNALFNIAAKNDETNESTTNETSGDETESPSDNEDGSIDVQTLFRAIERLSHTIGGKKATSGKAPRTSETGKKEISPGSCDECGCTPVHVFDYEHCQIETCDHCGPKHTFKNIIASSCEHVQDQCNADEHIHPSRRFSKMNPYTQPTHPKSKPVYMTGANNTRLGERPNAIPVQEKETAKRIATPPSETSDDSDTVQGTSNQQRLNTQSNIQLRLRRQGSDPRRWRNHCHFCGEHGHLLLACPKRPDVFRSRK